MYFVVDLQQQTIRACKSRGDAARSIAATMGDRIRSGDDPVKFVNDRYGDRFDVLTLSDSYSSIADAISQKTEGYSVELTQQFRDAIDEYYNR